MSKSPLPPIAILFLTIFIDILGFGIVLPLLPNYAKELGAEPLVIGVAVAGFSLMQFFFAPVWGGISDRIGRRPVILISVATSVISYLIFSQANSIWLLLVSRLLAGIGSANISTTQAYITDITDASNRSRSLGIIGAAFGLGFVFGPPVGGFLKTYYGMQSVGYLAVGLTSLDLVLAYFFLPESLKEKKAETAFKFFRFEKFSEAMQNPAIARLFVINFLFTLGFVNMQVSASLLGKEHFAMTEETIGYGFALIGVLSVIVQGGLIGVLARKFGERRLQAAGCLLMAAGLTLIPFSPDLRVAAVAVSLLAIGNGLTTPVNTALVSIYTSQPLQGEMLGLSQSVGSLARIAGPFSGSLLYGLDYHAPYLMAGAVLLLATLLSISLLGADLTPEPSPQS